MVRDSRKPGVAQRHTLSLWTVCLGYGCLMTLVSSLSGCDTPHAPAPGADTPQEDTRPAPPAPPLKETPARVVDASTLFPRRWGERVAVLDLCGLDTLPDSCECFGTVLSLDAGGLRYRPRNRSGPGLLEKGLQLDAASVDTVTVDLALTCRGMPSEFQAVRFFWARATDTPDPATGWPFSEARHVPFSSDEVVPSERWVARPHAHPHWNGVIERVFVELAIPEPLWEAMPACEVLVRSVAYWRRAPEDSDV